ncbi:hypothetical protein bthur0013_59320 [Bacillus thuringiensis IBL 200]|nr:hypothetical protein bthur0013_59320 [Bacillus thuringiensis IBL 200]
MISVIFSFSAFFHFCIPCILLFSLNSLTHRAEMKKQKSHA